MKNKFRIGIDDMLAIKGGNNESSEFMSSSECWCTCHCMEVDVMGFQLGMMVNVSTGKLENPKCSTALSTIFQ